MLSVCALWPAGPILITGDFNLEKLATCLPTCFRSCLHGDEICMKAHSERNNNITDDDELWTCWSNYFSNLAKSCNDYHVISVLIM